jgi:membrane-bound serine protease (ClpP class)
VRFIRAFLALGAALAVCLVIAGAAAAQEQPRVLAIELQNDINPVTADFVTREIDRAVEDGYSAAVILLDTPGGLASAMEEITKKELAAPIPVIVYVSPSGARAASAGVWIAQASDILAMAPQTNIGSSTPIAVGGTDIQGDLRRKVVNDAAASLRSLAEAHDRNVEWADEAVRTASNLTAEEAVEQNVADLIAPDLQSLLDEIDGWTTKGDKGLVLDTADAEVTTVEMSLWDRILDTIIDPNIITLLLSLGVLAITVELFNPGLIFPAVFGAIALIIGLFGLQVLPFSWAGILLMIVAFAFFIAEIFITSHGALAAAGVVSFIFGALMLFNPAGDTYEVSLPVALGIAAAFAVFVGFVLTKALAARRAKPKTGLDELIGEVGVVRETLDPEGRVFVHGELWSARVSGGEPIPTGASVKVERLTDGLVLEVSRVEEPAPVA